MGIIGAATQTAMAVTIFQEKIDGTVLFVQVDRRHLLRFFFLQRHPHSRCSSAAANSLPVRKYGVCCSPAPCASFQVFPVQVWNSPCPVCCVWQPESPNTKRKSKSKGSSCDSNSKGTFRQSPEHAGPGTDSPTSTEGFPSQESLLPARQAWPGILAAGVVSGLHTFLKISSSLWNSVFVPRPPPCQPQRISMLPPGSPLDPSLPLFACSTRGCRAFSHRPHVPCTECSRGSLALNCSVLDEAGHVLPHPGCTCTMHPGNGGELFTERGYQGQQGHATAAAVQEPYYPFIAFEGDVAAGMRVPWGSAKVGPSGKVPGGLDLNRAVYRCTSPGCAFLSNTAEADCPLCPSGKASWILTLVKGIFREGSLDAGGRDLVPEPAFLPLAFPSDGAAGGARSGGQRGKLESDDVAHRLNLRHADVEADHGPWILTRWLEELPRGRAREVLLREGISGFQWMRRIPATIKAPGDLQSSDRSTTSDPAGEYRSKLDILTAALAKFLPDQSLSRDATATHSHPPPFSSTRLLWDMRVLEDMQAMEVDSACDREWARPSQSGDNDGGLLGGTPSGGFPSGHPKKQKIPGIGVLRSQSQPIWAMEGSGLRCSVRFRFREDCSEVRRQQSSPCAVFLHLGDITKWAVDGEHDAIVCSTNEMLLPEGEGDHDATVSCSNKVLRKGKTPLSGEGEGHIDEGSSLLLQGQGSVSSTSEKHRQEGGGVVDRAIHSAAGPELSFMCCAVRPGCFAVRCPTGQAVTTGPGKLAVSLVIHTVGPTYCQMEQSPGPSPSTLLAAAYRNSLEQAMMNGVKHVAFPAISCGGKGYPLREAAAVAVESVWGSCMALEGTLPEVHFVLSSPEEYEAWMEVCKA